MKISELRNPIDFGLGRSFSWWDPDTECELVVAEPGAEPDLWAEYSSGALRSYRKHGVECALDIDAMRTGNDTVMFLAAVNPAGQVVGGVRALGPLTSAEDSHALMEWEGQPGQRAVRKMISDRVPFGILEMKSAWVADDPERYRSLTKALARSGPNLIGLLGVQFCMATAASYVLDRWQTSGGIVAPIAATPYPDHRYRTKLMWWDRSTLFNKADPRQVSKILAETANLKEGFYGHLEAAQRSGS